MLSHYIFRLFCQSDVRKGGYMKVKLVLVLVIVLVIVLLIVSSVIFSQVNTVVEWESYDGSPIGIYAGGFVLCDEALYSIGGSWSRGFQRENYQYDPKTNIWTEKASMKSAH